MNNFKKFTKAIVIHSLIFSLIQTSFIFTAQAETKIERNEITGREILGAANGALQTYGQFLGQKQQIIQQQIAAQKNQAMMQQLSPSCRKPDGTACYTVAGQFFPECPIPASMSAMPQNVCSAASPDPSAISSMITYESISKSWMNYFDQMLNEASNSKTPFGMKCLQDKQKALDSQLTEMVNNLTRMQDQLNKDKETFKANNKKLLEDMKTSNEELNGIGNSNNLALRAKDFSKLFSQSCQSVIGDQNISILAQKGLIGTMQELAVPNKRAADYNSNRTLIESDLRRDIERIQKTIADGGLQDYFDGKITDSSKFQSLVLATQKQSAEFKLAKDRIALELRKVGYELPTMDKNFAVDYNEFLGGSATYFKKQYINDCVTGADKSGTAISTEQILASLKQNSTGSQGTARDKYRAALQTILASDAFIEDKLGQIKALENTYKDISITYQNANSQRVTSTPYDLYMKTLTACESRFAQDDTFSTTGSGVSQKKKVERGQALLRDLKNLHDNYSSQLGSRVLEQVMNCNGEAKKSGATCGDENSFNSQAPTFCMAQASQCANEVQGCYAEASKHVETRKTKLVAQAAAFNKNAEALIARSNAIYKAQTTAVMDMVKVVQARFPGTNFEIPTGMFISMPELKKDTYGVDMVNDGNVSFMDELPRKIDLLKKVFKDQQQAANNEIKSYIENQKQAMNREKDRWNTLAGECKQMIEASSKGLEKTNNDNMKRQAEMDGKVRSFCRKYQALASHPVGGCENAKKLSSEVDDVMSRVLPSVVTNVNEFNGVCNAYGNESDTTSNAAISSRAADCRVDMGKDADSVKNCKAIIAQETKLLEAAGKKVPGKGKSAGTDIKALCGSNGKNDNVALVDKILAKLPAVEQKKFASSSKKDLLVTALKTGNFDKVKEEGLDDLQDGNVFTDISELIGPLKNNEQACKKLVAINDIKVPEVAATTTATTPAVAAVAKPASPAPEDNSALKAKKESLEAEVAKQNQMNTDRSATTEGIDAQAKKVTALKAEVAALEQSSTSTTAAAAKTEKPKETVTEAEKKQNADLKIILSNLTTASLAEPSSGEVKIAELTRIGEQVDANTVCDSQAANNNIAKAFSGGLLPSGFDASILGSSK